MKNFTNRKFTHIKSLEKALSILGAFTIESPMLTLSQISQATGIPKPTAVNFVNTLLECDYLRLLPNSQNYVLGYKAFNTGFIARSSIAIIQSTLPLLENLQISTGEIVYLTTTVNGYVLYLEGAFPAKRIVSYSVAGKMNKMLSNACGKAMLAYMSKEQINSIIERDGLTKYTPNSITDRQSMLKELETIRARGYAIDNEEKHVGTRCIATPVFNKNHQAVGSVSVSGPAASMTDEKLAKILPELSSLTGYLENIAQDFPAKFISV